MQLIGPPILRECRISLPLPAGKPPNPTKKQPLSVPQNPCAQLFFTINPETPPENLVKQLKQSWEYDPLTTLKLICYLRTLREERDSYNEGFYVAAFWLHKNHPLTLACNVRELASFGSLRDFSEILCRIVNERESTESCKRSSPPSSLKGEREHDKMETARRAVCKYVQDPAYRFLHERVSDLFADLLRSDLETLKSGNDEILSFAARDCPSIDSSYDRHTLLCESIAKKVFPRESGRDYEGIEDVHYVYRVRNRLRKEILGPLRMALDIEKQGRRGGDKQFQDCTLIFMKKAYQKMLKMKDTGSKLKYYKIIQAMILKANGQSFLSTPLSIIASLKEENIGQKELEWQNMVQAFSTRGKLSNSLAVCDISDEMEERTRNVSISMGLLISELSSSSWKGTVYGFQESPKLYKIEGDDLPSKFNFIKQLKCTKRVNIETILNQVLQVGVKQKLNKEKMVQRVFVFTNKDFRKAVNNSWGWNYRAVWENYQKFGYDQVPEVVFWNIKGFNVSPPTIRAAFYNRLLTINGFSKSLFAYFLDKGAVWRSEDIKSVTTAEDVMRITLSGKEYQNLAVLD
ncbi:uncharacterized protein LOC104906765 [Beta vulgaris subsp. vulgaris]|uniref:uncharacterized protein LOC104906765 n=1 Tax=Beta vulgaris subsp. vulgaris TaxID=3555 RepID=UPI002036FC1B|nr:uncharacterized protein LOC104906765 [Beta vulgaris subsp. vulgaris]